MQPNKDMPKFERILRSEINRMTDPTAREQAEDELDNMNAAKQYAEPGYTDPRELILMSNWNNLPGTENLEAAGYSIEWSDEWTTCNGCNKAVRTSPDSHGWKRSYAILNECDLLCVQCILADPTEYLDQIADQPTRAVTFDLDLTQHGLELVQDEFEAGFHRGQTDDPKKIYAKLKAEGRKRITFKIDSVGQFDLTFSVYAEPSEWSSDILAHAIGLINDAMVHDDATGHIYTLIYNAECDLQDRLREQSRIEQRPGYHNPNCDGDHCGKTSGEVRVLPTGGDSNAILCRVCYWFELAFRKERNRELDRDAQFDLPAWSSLKVYANN